MTQEILLTEKKKKGGSLNRNGLVYKSKLHHSSLSWLLGIIVYCCNVVWLIPPVMELFAAFCLCLFCYVVHWNAFSQIFEHLIFYHSFISSIYCALQLLMLFHHMISSFLKSVELYTASNDISGKSDRITVSIFSLFL